MIVIDTREQVPWVEEALGMPTVTGKLDAGDYSLLNYEHRVAIERKSLDDYVGTLLNARPRFYAELERLRAYEVRCVIVEASIRDILRGHYTSGVSGELIMAWTGELIACQAVPVYIAGGRPEAQVLAGAILRQSWKRLNSGVDRPA